MKRGVVVVTGGAGYIGTHAVELLLRRGYRVRVLDALLYGGAPLLDFLGDRNFEFIHGDAGSVSVLRRALDGAGAIVHLAGLVGDAACAADEGHARYANVTATATVKRIAREMGTGRLVFASSCSVYGSSAAPAREDDPLRPLSLYARTKAEAEAIVLRDRGPVASTVLRFGTVFGHSRRPRFDLVANRFAAQAIGDGVIRVTGGRQRRPFVYAGDLARAIEAVLSADHAAVRGRIFNVANDAANITIGELAGRIAAQTQPFRTVRIRRLPAGADARDYLVSSERIRRELGFAAPTSLEAGLTGLIRELAGGVPDVRRAV